MVGWLVGTEVLPTVKHKALNILFWFYFGGVSLGRTGSINEVKRGMNSLCNVQKNRASETKNDVLGVFL